jgi:hypothetical protein
VILQALFSLLWLSQKIFEPQRTQRFAQKTQNQIDWYSIFVSFVQTFVVKDNQAFMKASALVRGIIWAM